MIPELLFEDPLRLSYEQVKDLERLAQRAAKDMIGREMIFEVRIDFPFGSITEAHVRPF